MKTKDPESTSGKTMFSRGKKKGESWTERRDRAIKAGRKTGESR